MGEQKLQNPLFDKNLINAFVESVIKTIGDMAQTKVTPGKPTIEAKTASKGEVAGIIGMIAGGMKATLLLSFKKEATFEILQNMLGETHTEITPEISDAVGELTNMIYGGTKTTLNKLGYNFEMALPTVVTGQFSISSKHGGINLTIPFTTGNGNQFFIELSVEA